MLKPIFDDTLERRIAVGQPIPNYRFELISGQKTSIHEFIDGQNYLYLNFWASWCAGYRQEVDDLEHIYTNHSNKIKVISLNYNEDSTKTKSLTDKHNIAWVNGYLHQKLMKNYSLIDCQEIF